MSYPYASSSDEEAIHQLESETFAAIMKKDRSALSRILADDFVFRNPEGARLTKAEFVELIGGFPVKILAVRGDKLNVDLYGDTAVLTGIQRATTESGGVEETSAVAFTDVFVKRAGRWSMVLAYSVELPPEGVQHRPS